MTSKFNDLAKQTADELIAMSEVLAEKMETWADVFDRHPDSQNVGACAGFISSETSVHPIEVAIDVQTPPDTDSGVLRTRAIETTRDENGNERFNSIALQYSVDRSGAQQLVEKAGSITREDIKQLLHADTSKLDSLVVGNETGSDSKTQQLLGKHYNLDANELAALDQSTEDELVEELHAALARLQQTAADEAK